MRLSCTELGIAVAGPDTGRTLTLIDGSGPDRLHARRIEPDVLEIELVLAPESAAVYIIDPIDTPTRKEGVADAAGR